MLLYCPPDKLVYFLKFFTRSNLIEKYGKGKNVTFQNVHDFVEFNKQALVNLFRILLLRLLNAHSFRRSGGVRSCCNYRFTQFSSRIQIICYFLSRGHNNKLSYWGETHFFSSVSSFWVSRANIVQPQREISTYDKRVLQSDINLFAVAQHFPVTTTFRL